MNSRSSEIVIEVCVDSVASALAAERGGANRLELCSSLIEGGVTPSAGLIVTTKAAVSLPLHVMIRPRGGDFYYDSHEFETMKRDITLAKGLGADGVVLGILDVNGAVDLLRARELLESARPLSVTFHRAFDMTADLFRALENLCSVGVDRVLTSGGERTCISGCEKIARLIQAAQGRLIVMPGSGIKPENARDLIARTGAREIHVGLRTLVPSPMVYRNSKVVIASAGDWEYKRFVVLEENVRDLRKTLQSSSP